MTRTNLEFKLMLSLPLVERDSRWAATSTLPDKSVFDFPALGDGRLDCADFFQQF
jgi:hypothetical protein